MRNPFGPSSDDPDVTRNRRNRRLDDRTVEALLSGRAVEGEPELTGFVAETRALATTPTPNDALAALLDTGVTPSTAPVAVPAARGSRRKVQAAVAIGAALGLVVSAGAANALPGPVQNGVSDVVGWVSPLDLPHADDQPGPVPVPSPSRTAEPGDDNGSASPEPAEDHGSASPEPGDDHSGSGTGSDDGTTSGSGSSGSDDGSSSGSGSSGSGPSGSDGGSSGSGSGGSGSGGSDGSDDHGGSSTASPSPTHSESPRPAPSPTPSEDHSGSDDGH